MILIKLKGITAGFILGALIGAAIMNLAVGRQLDKAELNAKILSSQLDDQAGQLANMKLRLSETEKKLAAKNKLRVHDIDVHVEFDDEFEKVEIETSVKKLLKNLMLKEVNQLDPVLVTNIVDQRIVETPEHKYRVTVKQALVSERIIMYLTAKILKEQVL